MTIRSADEGVTVENSLDVLEVDLVIDQVRLALFRIPSEIANVCEQPFHIFRHSKSSQFGFDTVAPIEDRYDGKLVAARFRPSTLPVYTIVFQ